ncbi:hypothetical protein MTP02_00420 [Streptomyces albus]|nr:hypothetical protein MTP02_00420 [Streptomyces albus]
MREQAALLAEFTDCGVLDLVQDDAAHLGGEHVRVAGLPREQFAQTEFGEARAVEGGGVVQPDTAPGCGRTVRGSPPGGHLESDGAQPPRPSFGAMTSPSRRKILTAGGLGLLTVPLGGLAAPQAYGVAGRPATRAPAVALDVIGG